MPFEVTTLEIFRQGSFFEMSRYSCISLFTITASIVFSTFSTGQFCFKNCAGVIVLKFWFM